MTTLTTKCPACGHHEMELTVEHAIHDETQLDMILTCPECDAATNKFVSVKGFVGGFARIR